jgi:hypothetical protein
MHRDSKLVDRRLPLGYPGYEMRVVVVKHTTEYRRAPSYTTQYYALQTDGHEDHWVVAVEYIGSEWEEHMEEARGSLIRGLKREFKTRSLRELRIDEDDP